MLNHSWRWKAAVLGSLGLLILTIILAAALADGGSRSTPADASAGELARFLARAATPAATPTPTPASTPTRTPAPPALTEPQASQVVSGMTSGVRVRQQPQPPTPVVVEGLDYDWARTIFRLVNEIRAADGLATLRENALLRRAEEKYVEFLWRTNGGEIDHNLDGTPLDRALREGYNGWAGESLWGPAMGPEYQPEQAVSGWMSSPPHRAAILNPDFIEIGVACFRGKWVRSDGVVSPGHVCGKLFGVPCPPAPTPPPGWTPMPEPTPDPSQTPTPPPAPLPPTGPGAPPQPIPNSNPC